MMTNMALPLQCRVPRIQAGGLEWGRYQGQRGKRARGWKREDKNQTGEKWHEATNH